MSRLSVTTMVIAAAFLLMGGCFHDVSLDRHTFRSTPLRPATVVLMDTTTKEEFWKMDVPVCMRLRLDFSRSPEIEGFKYNPNPASELTWKLLPLDGNEAIDQGQCFLDGCRPFLIKLRYRSSPEQRDKGQSIIRTAPGAPPAELLEDGPSAAAADQSQNEAVVASSGNTQSVSGAQPSAQFSEVIVRPNAVYNQ